MIGVPAIVKATIIDNGHRFIISMVAQTEKNIFSSESFHTKDKLKKVSHSWIIGAIKLVLEDLIHQINRKLYLNFKYDRIGPEANDGANRPEQTITKKIDLITDTLKPEAEAEKSLPESGIFIAVTAFCRTLFL